MPLGPPGDRDRFDEYDECVDAISGDGTTVEEARRICGAWENESRNSALAANVVREFTANAPWDSSTDPTSTKTLRARYASEMVGRFRELERAIRTSIVENDAFGLTDEPLGSVVSNGALVSNVGETVTGIGKDAIAPAPPGSFNFPTDEAKVSEFMDWLREQERRGVLEVTQVGGARTRAAHTGWQNTYIRQAYGTGITHGQRGLKAAGITVPEQDLAAVLRAPQHADALGLLYTRAFNELDGVTKAMEQDIARTLADGLSQGWNPNRIGRELTNRVSAVGAHRGRLIARTEVIRATNEAALNRYADFGQRVDGVTAVVEWATAGDERVCPDCAALEGQIFDIRDARGRIPLHPQCRCLWLPVPANESPSGPVPLPDAAAQGVDLPDDF